MMTPASGEPAWEDEFGSMAGWGGAKREGGGWRLGWVGVQKEKELTGWL